MSLGRFVVEAKLQMDASRLFEFQDDASNVSASEFGGYGS
jgi:hypothetical protein